jgi:hypothetical protein
MTMTEIAIDVGIRGVDPAHPAVQWARVEIYQDFRRVPGLRVEERDLRGEGSFKGWETELIAALTATGTITGFVNVLKLWLGRDQRRSLKVTVRTIDEEKVYEISGENISVDALRDAIEAAVQSEQGS